MDTTPNSIALTFLARIDVDVADPSDLGVVAGEHRRIVSIIGGTVDGPGLSGRVLPGGADFQRLRIDGTQELDARYGLELEDGTRLYVENQALRAGDPEVMARLARGERVDPSLVYFRSTPRVHAPAGPWEWLNRRILLATGERTPDRVQLDVYLVE
ncbi:DUF3237 domain-containing protein [Microbacterium sp. G2-8]|uniref:DUF3237 domain-containing protein n=1 Tax=Microbacterium sp. G2-8 TaxID=2842454 RepID=UPI001C8A5251|nr:DUF3237 domain-containing protein [Microbacterium sp. G2-8]